MFLLTLLYIYNNCIQYKARTHLDIFYSVGPHQMRVLISSRFPLFHIICIIVFKKKLGKELCV